MNNDTIKMSLDTSTFTEICLKECGREKCSTVKNIVSGKKDWHILHYVLYGKGYFEHDNQTIELKKGNMFYIPPQTEVHYFPDQVQPWIYAWIGFDGRLANEYLRIFNISKDFPIFTDKELFPLASKFNNLADFYNSAGYLDLHCLSMVFDIFATIIDGNTTRKKTFTAKDAHVKQAIEYINYNYRFEITVKDIAASLNLAPNYLSNIFQEVLSISPKQYLIKTRMEKACNLLTDKTKLIKEVGSLVGYKNQLHFSSEFKKYKKISPREYKKFNE